MMPLVSKTELASIFGFSGKGLTLVGSVLEGDYAEKYADAQASKQTITAMMKKEKVPGFSEVIVADNTVQGISYLYVSVENLN